MAVEKTISEVKEVKTIESVTIKVKTVRSWKNEDQTDVTETSYEDKELSLVGLTENTFAEIEGKI